MPIGFKCEMCEKDLGEMNKGKMRHGSVVLCVDCWRKVEKAVRAFLKTSRETPDFIRDLLGRF